MGAELGLRASCCSISEVPLLVQVLLAPSAPRGAAAAAKDKREASAKVDADTDTEEGIGAGASPVAAASAATGVDTATAAEDNLDAGVDPEMSRDEVGPLSAPSASGSEEILGTPLAAESGSVPSVRFSVRAAKRQPAVTEQQLHGAAMLLALHSHSHSP